MNIFLSAIVCVSLVVATPAASAAIDAKEVHGLVAHIEQILFPDVAVYSYKLAHYKNDKIIKTFAFEMSMKEGKSLLVFSWPATSKHKYLLKSENNLWMYFSDVRRSIRLSARDSFMGTDANNYDLMQLNLIKDYTITDFSEATLDGENVVKVELDAKQNSEGYNKIIIWISPKEKRLLRTDCYSISGALIKIVQYKGVMEIGKYRVPSTVLISNQVNKDRSTLMEISKVQLKSKDELRESMFTLGYLETLE